MTVVAIVAIGIAGFLLGCIVGFVLYAFAQGLIEELGKKR